MEAVGSAMAGPELRAGAFHAHGVLGQVGAGGLADAQAAQGGGGGPAGDAGGQAFALGLIDEVAMDVAPVVIGSGKRYFGSVYAQHLLEDPHVVIQGDRVLHLRYRVRR